MDDADTLAADEPVSEDDQALKTMQNASPDQAAADAERDDYLYELEFELFLDALDMSGLENYRDEEGFLELDMTEFSNQATFNVDPVMEIELDDVSGRSELEMLSDEDRERMEELQAFETAGEEDVVDALPLDYYPIYRRYELSRASRSNLSGEELTELETIGDEEPTLLESFGQVFAGESDDDMDDEHPPAPDCDGVIAMKDGLFTLNPSGASRGLTLDAKLKALADEVLSKSCP